MFIDEVEIYVRSGNGGNGCVSFRREKFIPKGGPDGGNGGDGGNIVFFADENINTLYPLVGKHHWVARNGQPGMGKNRTGKSADDLVIHVPVGTQIHDRDIGIRLKDLTTPGDSVILLKGGKGGRGNRTFTTPTDQAPRFAEDGEPGKERNLRLELKLIADVGIVGLPNAGKSTLLSRVSRARPKIADYPFTTLIPQLGTIDLRGYRRLVLADIPGLIEGAHEGVGLGDAFLRHIERTRLILHLIDICPPEGAPTPAEAYTMIRHELAAYSPTLAAKREIVVANKMDLTDSQQNLDALREALGCTVYAISGVTGEGLERLGEILWDEVQEVRAEDKARAAANDVLAPIAPQSTDESPADPAAETTGTDTDAPPEQDA